MKLAFQVMAAVALSAQIANAKLPPPAPEEVAAQETRRAAEEARLQREKAQLEAAQDRVAERYRREHAQQPAGSGSTSTKDLPNNVKRPPGDAAPQGGGKQSAEAHSAPAR